MLRRMADDGCAPDTVAFNAAVTACRADAPSLWREARHHPLASSLLFLSLFCLVPFHAQNSNPRLPTRVLPQAVRLLERARAAGLADTITHNAALSVLERAGKWEEALALLSEMRRGGGGRPPANAVSFATVVTALATAREGGRALALLDEMARRATAPATASPLFFCLTRVPVLPSRPSRCFPQPPKGGIS